MIRWLLPLLCTTVLLRADPLADLQANLQQLAGADPVSGTIEFAFTSKTGDAKKPQLSGGRATAAIALDAEGLRITWAAAQLATARQEAEAGTGKPKQPTPTRNAMSRLDAVKVQDYLDAGAELLRRLAGATMLAATEDRWHDQPARLLTLKLEPPLSEEDKKIIREIDGTARLWLADDGTPLAAESSLRLKGRVMMVIGFEHSQKELFTFTRAGNRLVVTSHQLETVDDGGGQHSQAKTDVTIRLAGS